MTDDTATLIKAVQDGDRQAFADLVARHQKPVFNVAYRMLDSVEDARDVSQITFLKVFENIQRYDPRYKFYSWVYRIAVNESIDLLNRRKRQQPLPPDSVSPDPGPEGVFGDDQVSGRVQAALMDLNVDYRSLLVLKHVLGASYAEIAETLGIEVKTVKSRLFTARQALRERLEDGEEG